MDDRSPQRAQEPLNETVLCSLLQYDEALRAGHAPPDLSLPLGDPNCENVRFDEIARAAECLRQLEAALPRSKRPSPASGSSIPRQVGRFEVQYVLGTGGFGVVLKAEDRLLNRTVAIKVPRPHVLDSADLKKRFLREAQAAAQLDHPHIVPIYEAGIDGEMPYIAYAYCPGPTLSEWVKSRGTPLAPTRAATVVSQLAEAVHYSHERGILHRDIKPANVLLFPQNAPADESFPYVPRLSDLGLAKLIESSLEDTLSGMVLGTPLYMSPEQAKSLHTDTGPACDVYSLGAVLYFLLTGRPPFLATGLIDALTQVIERDPIAPLDLNPAVSRDLNTICLKCLEKSPARRYATARHLADDLQRFLARKPIQARPASTFSRVARWCRRQPAIAVLLAATVCLTAGLIAALSWNSYASAIYQHELRKRNSELSDALSHLDESLEHARQQRQLAESNESRVLEFLYTEDVRLAADSWKQGDVSSAARLLNRHDHLLRGQVEREFAGRYLEGQVSLPNRLLGNVGQAVWCAAYSQDGKWLAVSGGKALVQLFAVGENYRLVHTIATEQVEINSIGFSPDSSTLVTAGDDGRVGLWRTETGELLRWFNAMPGQQVFGVMLMDAGRKLVVAGRSPEITVWDVANGERLESFRAGSDVVENIAAAPDDQRFAAADAAGGVAIYRLGRPEPVLTYAPLEPYVSVLKFSADGQWLILGHHRGTLRVTDAQTGAVRAIVERSESIRGLAVSPHGQVACSDRGGVITLLDTPPQLETSPWRVLQLWAGDEKRINGLAFSKDGRSLVTGSMDGEVRLWALDHDYQTKRLMVPARRGKAFFQNDLSRVTSDGKLVRIGLPGLEVWDEGSDQPSKLLVPEARVAACSALLDDKRLMVGDELGRIALVNLEANAAPDWMQVFSAPIARMVSYAGGRTALALSKQDELALVDWPQRRVLQRLENRAAMAISPDEKWIVVANHGTNTLSILRADTFEEVARGSAHDNTIRHIEFSPDGRRLISLCNDRIALFWDTAVWRQEDMVLALTDKPTAAAFSPDGQTIAIGTVAGSVQLWSARNGQELFELAKFDDEVLSLRFSPAGDKLFATVSDMITHVFLAPGELELR